MSLRPNQVMISVPLESRRTAVTLGWALLAGRVIEATRPVTVHFCRLVHCAIRIISVAILLLRLAYAFFYRGDFHVLRNIHAD